MRVAYVCADPGVPVFGQKGCSIHVQEVIRALQRQGAEVDLFATRLGGNPPADLASVKVHRLPSIPKVERSVRERVALSINPDLDLELNLAAPFDLVYERYSLWSYSGMEYAQTAGIPGILEVNAPLIQEQAQHRGLVHREAAEQVATRAFRAATALIAVSREIETYLADWVEFPQTIHVIPNGVNPNRFSSDRHLEELNADQTFTVGFVGSLKPWHGLPHLVTAFEALHQRVSNARLLIVGDGPERQSLEADLGDRNLLAHTHFTGAVPPEAIPTWLSEMDVAVAPYPAESTFYFSPLKVYEYMAAALPVVVSRIGQLSDLIDDGVTGVLCEPGNPIALAEALEALWRSPQQRHQMGQAARRQILTHHTWDTVAQQILDIAGLQPRSPYAAITGGSPHESF